MIGLGRDINKCESAYSEATKQSSKNKDIQIEVFECDLTNIEAVNDFAKCVVSKLKTVDLLINVAGIMNFPKSVRTFLLI